MNYRPLVCCLLVVAGLYQFSPLKQACLSRCRTPLQFIMTSWREGYAAAYYLTRDALEQPLEKWRTILLLSGIAVAVLALIVEGVAVLFFTAGRRSAFGLNAVLQGALAALLLIGVNLWSFEHPLRVDFTRDQKFTLPPTIREQLAQLDRGSLDGDKQNKTTIVVYQRHKTFGSLSDKPDRFDYAAERRQFGQAIREFQAIQFKLADMETECAAARELLYQASARVDRREPDIGKYSAMAKLF